MPDMDSTRGALSDDAFDALVSALAEGGVRPEDLDEALHAREVTSLTPRERADLRDTLRVIEALRADPLLVEPPHGLWEKVASAIEAEGDLAATPATVADLDAHRSRRRGGAGARWWVPAAAAVAGLLVGGGAVWLNLQPSEAPETGPVAEPQVIGDAEMDPVAATGTTASAKMTREPDGSLELTVDVPEVPDAAAGYYEVWLRDADASRLISLGTISSTSTTLRVPEGIDFSRYPVVDVSHEHFDGDPTHSGTTLWAGAMTERS